jgi:cation:H+ antiporter
MAYGFVGVGVLLLLLGSEAMLRGGIGLARNFGVAPLVIGLLIVTASTSAPELAVVLQAARATPDIAIGDVVGSNLFSMLLILGFGALIQPLSSPPKVVFRDAGALLISTGALAVIAMSGTISRKVGLFLLAGFLAYLIVSFITDWRRSQHLSAHEGSSECRIGTKSFGMGSAYIIFGIIAVFLGARCLIDGGLAIASLYRLPQFLVALTLITLGTSVPELVVTMTAIARRRADFAAGHVITSSVFNILFVLGLAAFLHPVAISPVLAHNILLMAGAALLLVPLLMLSWRLTRVRGFVLVMFYCGYLGLLACQQHNITPQMIGLH